MSDQTNPSCSGCGGPHPFDTTVPSVVWNAVIRGGGLHDYLCLTCIVAAFVRANQSFTAELVGGGFSPPIPIEVRVREVVAQDAATVSNENTRLRADLEAAKAREEARNQREVEFKHIDATPNEGYPLRILRVYREACDLRWEEIGDGSIRNPSALLSAMNATQDVRAAILDRAISKLTASEPPGTAGGEEGT